MDSSDDDSDTFSKDFEAKRRGMERAREDRGCFPLNLYEKSSYPDNHTDPEYLSAMLVNPNAKSYSFEHTTVLSTRIVLQLSASVIFLIVYYNLRQELLSATVVQTGALISTSIGYFIYNILPQMYESSNRNIRGFLNCFPREHVKVTILYFILAHQLSPVMRTLTLTVSTDTIHATSIGMVVIHLFTCDYGMPGFLRSKTISANAAVIGSICLASRMTTDFHSMALLTFAVEIFILFPRFSSCIWNSTLSLVLSILIGSLCCSSVSATLFLTFISIVFTVIVLIPALFVVCVHYKNNIYGPWDEALILKKKDERTKNKDKTM